MSVDKYIEIIGVVFAILQVLWAVKNKPINFVFGIISILLAIYILVKAHLFAEVGLNFYYLMMSIYGLYLWIRQTPQAQQDRPITYTNRSEYVYLIGIILGSFFVNAAVIKQFIHSDVLYWDAAVAAFAYGGMWLMAKRKIEYWLVLNISNLLAIPLQFRKDLDYYAMLSILQFIIALFGFMQWQKLYKIQQQTCQSKL